MIISKKEFRELGFLYDEKNEQLLESCIARAEYILNALSGGTLASAMAQSKSNAALVRQAAAFQADALFKAELKEQRAEQRAEQAEQSSTNESVSTHVSLGDLSYTESSGSGSSRRVSAESVSADSPFHVPRTVERLLRAAGCIPYTAAEVIE